MAALTADRKNEFAAGGGERYREGGVAANAVIKKGALLCKNVAGYIVPAVNTLNFKVIGIAQNATDATGLADGIGRVMYLTHCSVKMVNDGVSPIVQASLFGSVYVKDDQTVQTAAGNGVIAGIAESIESDGQIFVFVDCK